MILTCKCGEHYQTDGRYTSPANSLLDWKWWKEEHESGKCQEEVVSK